MPGAVGALALTVSLSLLLSRLPHVPQVVQGKPLDGPGLADLVQQVVEGLNERDIPTGAPLCSCRRAC